MTGIGKQKPLGEFNELCLSFVKEAKGNSAVDYISSVPEPGGSNEGSSSIRTTVNSQPPLQDPTVPRPKKQKKNETLTIRSMEKDSPVDSTWKTELINHIKVTDESRVAAELNIFKLKEYNLILRNLQLERDLGLSQKGIENLRNDINPELNRYPHFSTDCVDFVTDDQVIS